jgi:small-conductance mechanosensitive channel
MEELVGNFMLDQMVAGYSVATYLQALGTWIGTYALFTMVFLIAKKAVPRLRLGKPLKDSIVQALKAVKSWVLLFISLLIAAKAFKLPNEAKTAVNFAISLMTLIQILVIANIWISYLFNDTAFAGAKNGQLRTVRGSLSSLSVITIWVMGFLLLLDNFGFNVGTIIAGLGVGGIAIGLALQSVLGDVIASFCIGLDHPFEVGDAIQVDNFNGTIEEVGLKTTKVRSLSGEIIVFPNANLVNSRIRNYKRMKERRIVFNVGVSYNTEERHLAAIPEWVKEVMAPLDVRLDRVHFSTFGDSALIYEIVYYVLSADYTKYMDVQHTINLGILKKFRAEGVEIAFPTQTLDLPDQTIERFAAVFASQLPHHSHSLKDNT